MGTAITVKTQAKHHYNNTFLEGFVPDINDLLRSNGFDLPLIEKYKIYIAQSQSIGWLESKSGHLADVSHIVESIKILDDGVIVNAKVLATPSGQKLKELCNYVDFKFMPIIVDHHLVSFNIFIDN